MDETNRREEIRRGVDKTMAVSNDQKKTFDAIWGLLNRLRGGVHANDIEMHIVGILFYRFVSEKITDYIDKGEDDPNFSYANLTDEEAEQARNGLTEELGYFILPSNLFQNIAKQKTDKDFNIILGNAFRRFDESARGAKSEKDFSGLLSDIDFSTPRLGPTVADRNKVIVDIFDVFEKLDIDYTNADNDIFGDIYEYLMHKFASNAGKSGGEFYTPQPVSTLLAKLGLHEQKKTIKNVYDPACGSGSLLLQVKKQLGKDGDGIKYYGQEINVTTQNICRMNMIVHGVNYDKFDIALGDTLTDPKHLDYAPFDVIVSNPPYSTIWAGSDNPTLINDERFAPAGVLAPKSKADLAFTMHILSMLSDTGKAAIVEFPGVLYRGGAEQKIRKYLVDNNYVEAIIQLPDNMFYGVSIATCIIILSKHKADEKVLFVDASNCYIHESNKNKLSDENINLIDNTVSDRKDIDHFAKLVDNDKIGEEAYNLSVSTWVEKEDTREKIDITELNNRIADIVKCEQELRNKIDAIVAEIDIDNDNNSNTKDAQNNGRQNEKA